MFDTKLIGTPPRIVIFIRNILPAVDRELQTWQEYLQNCPDHILRKNALASIKKKRFHGQGGSFYALYAPNSYRKSLIRFIVAYQTISDYLDNLCDRAGVYDKQAFEQLHLSMTDALKPGKKHEEYYLYYPHREDGGYLGSLVSTCQETLANFPGFLSVQGNCLNLCKLYCELQIYKHLQKEERVQYLTQWYQENNNDNWLEWWEFSAATGSTLGIFLLAAEATKMESITNHTQNEYLAAYFPWISGLHILLDYFIDQEEDRLEGDLNFISFYEDNSECKRRVSKIIDNSFSMADKLDNRGFHKTILCGLLSLYLSDEKALTEENKELSSFFLQKGGTTSKLMFKICRYLREKNKI